MNEYKTILQILDEVFAGKSLNDVFKYYTRDIEKKAIISKIKDISYGLLRNYFKIKLTVEQLISKKPNNKIFNILLIAIYEIDFTKKPHFAICNDLVDLSLDITKENSIKNFVNAVIRNYLRNKINIQQKLKQLNNQEYQYNFQKSWIKKIKNDYPNEYIKIIHASNIIPKIALRVNNRRSSIKLYTQELDKHNIAYKIIDNKIVLNENLSVDNIPLFKEGVVSIQDVSAQKLQDIIQIPQKSYILDACSAPGGKSCQILENNDVELLALDINQERLKTLSNNFMRLGLSATIKQGDASTIQQWWDGKMFDIIIADVPCSASGTIKKNPDIKINRQLSDINNFVQQQQNIVLNLWRTLKVHGQLIYITCSIFKEENQNNTQYFIDILQAKKIKELTIMPSEYGDGFYYCIMEKIKA